MMIEQRQQRGYIENLKRDHRTRALMDAWVHQAMMEQEAKGQPSNTYDAIKMANAVAERAVVLAMEFVLDNDREYQMVCEQRDKLMEACVKNVTLNAFPQVIA